MFFSLADACGSRKLKDTLWLHHTDAAGGMSEGGCLRGAATLTSVRLESWAVVECGFGKGDGLCLIAEELLL